MTITLSLGWWLAPLAVTLVAFAWASISTPPRRGGGYGLDLTGAFLSGFALIVSLIAWLIWAVLT